MKRVFADTFFFFAYLSSEDQAHREASAYLDNFHGELITTEWVLMELGDGLAGRSDREVFVRFYETLCSDPTVTIIAADANLFQAAMGLYRSRSDKEWSLTDCTSFVVMREQGLSDALTGDHHFQQAGFNVLLSR
jgi:uncharacterized protein